MKNYLYNYFLTHLEDINNKHSCLTDLANLTDYKLIMHTPIENESEYEYDIANSQYNTYIQAEKIKRYLENNIEEYFEINEWELFVRLKNGDKFIYDQYYHSVRFLKDNYEPTEKEEKREFKNRLKKLMDHKWINQEELAKRTGVSQPMISRYINGQALPSYTMLRKLAKALNCSIEDFYYKEF